MLKISTEQLDQLSDARQHAVSKQIAEFLYPKFESVTPTLNCAEFDKKVSRLVTECLKRNPKFERTLWLYSLLGVAIPESQFYGPSVQDFFRLVRPEFDERVEMFYFLFVRSLGYEGDKWLE